MVLWSHKKKGGKIFFFSLSLFCWFGFGGSLSRLSDFLYIFESFYVCDKLLQKKEEDGGEEKVQKSSKKKKNSRDFVCVGVPRRREQERQRDRERQRERDGE